MAGETEVQGIALGLGLDTTAFSAGIARAKGELEGLRRAAKSLEVNVGIRGQTGGRGGAAHAATAMYDPVVSPGFQVSRGAVRDLRVSINQQLRQLRAQGQAVEVPIRLGRVPFGSIRSEITRGIGEVPVTIRVSNIGAQREMLAAFLSTQTGATMGQARASVESAAASRGIPRRRFGGPVTANQPYLVGENGPEIMWPHSSGRIPHAMGGAQILQRLQHASSRLQPHHIAGGVDWYRMAGRLAAEKAAQYGMELRQAQGILAALSAGTSWESNKTKFERVLSDHSRGRPFRYGMQLDAHRKAAAILGGADPTAVFASSPKISQFYRGITGDTGSLTLDRWATRTSMGRDIPPRGGKARHALEQAWFTAAGERNLAPAEYQAALWLMEKEQSGQVPGQMGLGLARGGKVAPGQRGMFEPVPQPGYCSRCRVSYPASGRSRHYASQSHLDIAAGRRSARGLSMGPRSSITSAGAYRRERYNAAWRMASQDPSEEEYRRNLEDMMSMTELGASARFDLGESRPYEGEGTYFHRMARGGFAGGIVALRDVASAYARSRGMRPPPTGFYHPIDRDFSLRTAAAYEAMPTGPDAFSRRAYRAFADETLDQYAFLRKAGFHFTPSRTDPYHPGPGQTKMQLAGEDVLRNRNLTAFASALEHPLLTKRENWIFRGVHDMFGHLAEGFSIGPRGEMNAAIKHSQMYSPLAQRAMLAETHGQNSVVNFSPTMAPGFGRSIADVNRESPGTIYAAQKAQVLPKAIVDEFNARFGLRARGGRVDWRALDMLTSPFAGREATGLGGSIHPFGKRLQPTIADLFRSPRMGRLFTPYPPYSKNAEGGDVPPGTFIVGEIGRERFVPTSKEGIIPPDVAAQIPGGSLLARINARQAAAAEPWMPEWRRRGIAKDLTGHRSRGGTIDIEAGSHLWQAPENGWIIPNRLMNRVPRAQAGAYAGYQQTPHGYRDPATGRWVSGATVAGAQRRQESEDEARHQVEQRAKAARERLSQLIPKAYLGDSSLDELRRVRAENIPIGGRTPRTLLGAAAGFLATGEQKNLAAEQYRTASRGLLELRKTVGPNFMGELNEQVERSRLSLRELAKTHGRDSDEVRKGIKVYRDSLTLREHARDLEREQGEALGKLRTGVPDIAKSFVALQGTFAAYQIGLSALNTTVELGTRAVGPMIDQWTGWSGVALKVGSQLADQTRQLGGNAPAAIATAAGSAGIGGVGYLQRNLGPTVTAQAAATAAAEALDLRRAAFYAQTRPGGGIPGLTGGPTGGIAGTGLGWQVFGGQESFSQTVARGIAEAGDARTAPVTRMRPGIPLGPLSALGIGAGPELVPPDPARRQAAQDRLDSSIADFNSAIGRGATYLGQQPTGLRLAQRDITAPEFEVAKKQFLAAAAAAGDLDNATTEAARGVILMDTATGRVVSTAEEYRKALSQSAQGTLIESPEAFTQRMVMGLQGAFKTSAAQGQFERGVTIPSQYALDLLANPPSRAGAGFGFTRAEAQRNAGGVAAIQTLHDQIASGVTDGLQQARSLIRDYGGGGSAYQQNTGNGGPATLLDQFNANVSDISKYGNQIRDLNDEIANAQAGLARRQFSNSIRIMSRNLQDALALVGRRTTGGEQGALERRQFLLGRESQSLQLAMSQRQINFQTAIAGFQAPGITGQERAARTIEAQLEAKFGQKQLDIQKQQFAVEGQSFVVQGRRAVVDLKAAIDLEAASRDTTLLTIRNQKLVSANQVLLSRAQANAASILAEAARNHDAILSVADQRVRLFGGTIEGATNALRGVLGLGSQHTYLNSQGQVVTKTAPDSTPYGGGHAGGVVFDARGRTTLTVGEAQGEKVVVLKNPRQTDFGSSGFGGVGGGVSIGPIVISGNTIKDTMDLRLIAVEVADEVERRLSVKAKVLGLRTSGF